MKIRNNFFAVAVALLVFAVPLLALASFPDVHPVDSNKNAIDYMQQKGIIGGYPNGTFQAERQITRAEFTKIIVKTKFSDNEIQKCTNSQFKDVKPGQWYSNYICLAKKGLVNGYPDGTFQPHNNVTFVEAAKILCNAFLANEQLQNGTQDWYIPYVNALSDHFAIPLTIAKLDSALTRGEVAEMIYRLDTRTKNLPSFATKEVGDRDLIDTYYANLSGGKQEDAYKMKVAPGMTLDEFKNLYKDFFGGVARELTKIGPSTYEFTVMTHPNVQGQITLNHKNERVELFKVKMQVVDKKLKTLASTKLTSEVLEEVAHGNQKATLEWDNGFYKIYVLSDGRKTLASQHDTIDGISLGIRELDFSPNGKYLTYELYDWEFGGVLVYDIAQHQEINQALDGTGLYGFTPDDEYFYLCSEAGISSGDLVIVDLPGFNKMVRPVDLENGKDGYLEGCGPFDASTRTLHYQLNKDGKTVDRPYKIPG